MKELTNLDSDYTLKMFADETNKRHDNIKRDFNNMISNLSDDLLTSLKFEERKFKTSGGNTYTTISMDKRTALLFASKFNDNLRLKLILKIEEKQAIIDRQSQHKLVTYSDGTESLRKLIKTYYPDTLKEQSTWRKLVQKGIVRYEERITHIKVLLDETYGEQQQDSIRWNDNILNVLDELAEGN